MRSTDWASLDRPLTDDERAWLETREMFEVIAAVDARVDNMDDDSDETEDETGDAPKYDDWSSADLKAEVKRRQDEGRQLDVKGLTKKSEVAAVLRADDAANAGE